MVPGKKKKTEAKKTKTILHPWLMGILRHHLKSVEALTLVIGQGFIALVDRAVVGREDTGGQASFHCTLHAL